MTDMTEIPRFVKKDPSIRLHRNGIDMWGLYAEAVKYTSLGEAYLIGRFFVAGNMVCYYERPIADKRTVWRSNQYVDAATAQTNFQNRLSRGGWVLRGTPVLVQLKAPDKVEIDNGKMPQARYVAVLTHEDAFGQADHSTLVDPRPINESVIEWAAASAGDEKEDDGAELPF
jgi:hypothetical protein